MMRPALITVAVLVTVGTVYYLILSSLPGVRVSSWWRSPWHNLAVGGQPWSLHQLGLAWDLVGEQVSVMQAQVYALGLPFLRLVPESDHLHVQLG